MLGKTYELKDLCEDLRVIKRYICKLLCMEFYFIVEVRISTNEKYIEAYKRRLTVCEVGMTAVNSLTVSVRS